MRLVHCSVLTILLFCSCKNISQDALSNDLKFNPEKIDQIKIKNLNCVQRLTRDFTITQLNSINEVCTALNKMTSVDDVSVNIHHCSNVLTIHLEDEDYVETVGLIYTVYDGIIISYDGKNYRNDNLERRLLLEQQKH